MPLSRTLHVELTDLAKSLQRHGRGRDSVLAHITPKEAALLKARGGRGSTNPVTGLLEFDDSFDLSPVNVTPSSFSPAPDISAAPTPAPDVQNPVAQPIEQVSVTGQGQQPTSINVPTEFGFSSPTAQQLRLATPSVPNDQSLPTPQPQTVTAPTTQPQIQDVGAIQAPVPNLPTTGTTTGGAPDTTANQDTKDWLTNNKTLLELGGLGALGLYGGINSSKAAGQAAALQNNLSNIATPLSNAGNAALSGVQSGALTPANLQALQAVQAQTAQGQKSGAVSSQQAAEAVSTTFANLLNNQLNQAMALLNQADGYLQTAYIQGYQANIANQTNTQNFYSNLAQLAARMAGVGGGTTINLGAGA